VLNDENPAPAANPARASSFDELRLSESVMQAVKEMGFTEPSPIQAEVIPLARQGSDLVGQAQTGTGKTAAFSIPILELLDAKETKPQALVLVPTRELALQVTEEVTKLGKHTGLRSLAVYGGQEIEKQIRDLEHHPHIIVGTPGRILDHLSRYTLDLSKIRMCVLDEADRMLDMGFIDDVQFILDKCPKDRQTMLFSATMPGPILEMAKKHLQTPEFIRVSADKLTVEGITQYFVSVDPRDKLDALASILEQKRDGLTIVFASTKHWADTMCHKLQEAGFKAQPLHGNLTQAMRDQVMQDFRDGKVDVLVATDLASRGLDIDDVGLVVNYDLPVEYEYYVHRIGRTGRMGKQGVAVTLVTNVHEIKQLRKIAAMAQSSVNALPDFQITRRIPRRERREGGYGERGRFGDRGRFDRGPRREGGGFGRGRGPRFGGGERREGGFREDRPREHRGGPPFERRERREPREGFGGEGAEPREASEPRPAEGESFGGSPPPREPGFAPRGEPRGPPREGGPGDESGPRRRRGRRGGRRGRGGGFRHRYGFSTEVTLGSR
jgi:superfamily II DNA/RNA helicase